MLDLLLPRPCAGCGAREGPWCSRCSAALPLPLLELAVPLGPALAEAVGASHGDLPVVAATAYADGGRRLLLAFKESGRHELAGRLGELLARSVLALVLARTPGPAPSGPGALRLVPVPSRPRTRRSRGADLGLLVARSAAARLRSVGWDVRAVPLLRHHRASVDQAGLTRSGRSRNVTGTLTARGRNHAVSEAPPIGRVVLVDDIVTTGATLREAARALLVAGFPVIGASVVAATPAGRRTGDVPLGAAPLSTAGGGG